MTDILQAITARSSSPTLRSLSRVFGEVIRQAPVLLLFLVSLGFRIWVAPPPLSPQTIGNLWAYDYSPALSWATGYGLVVGAPSTLQGIEPTDSVSLSSIAKPFEPFRLPRPTYASTFRPPLYAFLSGLAMKLTGTTNVGPLLDLQKIVDSLVPVLVFLILVPLTGQRIAWLGAAASVIWYPEAATASLYYATALASFVLTSCLALFFVMISRPSITRALLFGIGSAALVFLRPELVLVPLLLSIYWWIQAPHRGIRTALITTVSVLIVGSTIAAWSFRNRVATGHFGFTSQVGAALWEGMASQSGFFPDYSTYGNDEVIQEILKTRGIRLTSSIGTFFDGPRGMEANSYLLRLFVADVVKRRVSLLGHVAFKLIENYRSTRNWVDSLNEFSRAHRGAWFLLGAASLDFTVLILPFLCLVLIRWSAPAHRLMGVFLVPILALHLGLALTVGGQLRYTVPVSPCYPALLACTVSLLSDRFGMRPFLEREYTIKTFASCVALALILIVIFSFSWLSAASKPPRRLSVSLLPVESAKSVSVNSGVLLNPAPAFTLTNFGAKKPVEFVPFPYYPGISGPQNVLQLTDGVTHAELEYQVPGWVGWGMNAPTVFVAVSLGESHYVVKVRVHAVQKEKSFPLSRVAVWQKDESGSRAINGVDPLPTSTKTAWIEVPVQRIMDTVWIELRPTDINDRYIFVDEIEVLGSDSYASLGEVVFKPIRLTQTLQGRPKLVGSVPVGSAAELFYRRASRSSDWQSSGWDETYSRDSVQFKFVLRSSADLNKTPHITAILFDDRK